MRTFPPALVLLACLTGAVACGKSEDAAKPEPQKQPAPKTAVCMPGVWLKGRSKAGSGSGPAAVEDTQAARPSADKPLIHRAGRARSMVGSSIVCANPPPPYNSKVRRRGIR